MKTVNLANVKISPKYFLYLIVVIMFILGAYYIAKFLFGYLTAKVGVASKVTESTSGW